VTAAGLRPPATREARLAAEAATNGAWPDELHRWYALQDGIVGHPYAVIFPGFWPLPLDGVVRTWAMYRDIVQQNAVKEIDALQAGAARRDGIARHEAAPAGTIAGMFLPSFVPIGDNGSACTLALDLRSGPSSGCVTPYLR
jgi:cell wall assembly regulator SMI1